MTKTKILNFIYFLVALCAVVLAFADEIQTIEAIAPEIAHYWPLVSTLALLLPRLGKVLGDFLDDGELNNSFVIQPIQKDPPT